MLKQQGSEFQTQSVIFCPYDSALQGHKVLLQVLPYGTFHFTDVLRRRPLCCHSGTQGIQAGLYIRLSN